MNQIWFVGLLGQTIGTLTGNQSGSHFFSSVPLDTKQSCPSHRTYANSSAC